VRAFTISGVGNVCGVGEEVQVRSQVWISGATCGDS
jgi:hypothetical protein